MDLLIQAIKGEERDYTSGSIRAAIFLLAVPMILELSLESVFAVVDMYFVGKLGADAIAVIGYTETMITIIYSVAIGLSTGAAAIVARRIGEKNPEEASKSAAQAMILGLILGIGLSVVTSLNADKLLGFMGATEQVIAQGKSFSSIMFGSSFIIILLFLINGIFRGAGNAALAMKSLWIASFLNIILDPILIYGLGNWSGFGLKGAAIATCIGRSAGVGYQIWHAFFKHHNIQITKKHFSIMPKMMKSIFQLSWPATFQFMIASGSWIFLTKIIAEAGGTTASAGYQIAIRNMIFFILPAWGLSNAAATLIGQNLGAKQIDRAEQSVLITTKYNVVFMLLVSLLFIFFAKGLVGLFSSDEAVVEIGKSALQILGSGFIFYGIGMVMMQALNGAGDTRTPTFINFVCFWLIQIPMAYILVYHTSIGIQGAFWAVPGAETVLAVMAFLYFKSGKWKKVEI